MLASIVLFVLAAVIFRVLYEMYGGSPPKYPFRTTQRGYKFRILHLRSEYGRWVFIDSPSGKGDVWYWDEPLFGRT